MTAAARRQSAPTQAGDRRAMLAKVHLAKKDLALADDTYRAVIERIAGKTSSKDCSDRQLHAVLEEFKRLGWKPKRRGAVRRPPAAPRPIAHDEQASKIRAMWLSLWCLGERDDLSEEAIEAFVARQTRSPGNPDGIKHMQWLDARGYDRVIRALRAWCERIGFPQPTAADVKRINTIRERATIEPASYGLVCKIMLFRALWNRLQRAEAFRHGIHAREDTFIKRHQPAITSAEFFDDAPADAACRELGQWWRRVKLAKAESRGDAEGENE